MCTRWANHRYILTLLSAFLAPAAWGAELDQAALSADQAPPGTIWLESLDLSKIEQGWGKPHASRSVDEHPLRIHGEEFKHGIGTHAVSEMHVDLHGAAEEFVSMVGVDDDALKKGTVAFEVWVDGKKVADSGQMHTGDSPRRLQAELHGAKHLLLLVSDCDGSIDYGHADWAGAVLALTPGASERPQTTTAPQDATEPPPIIFAEKPDEEKAREIEDAAAVLAFWASEHLRQEVARLISDI